MRSHPDHGRWSHRVKLRTDIIVKKMKMIRWIPLIIVYLMTQACDPKDVSSTSIDVQGHRGCRGIMPENSIPAFLKALEMGVPTLELDVVISKDLDVIVSHDPYFSHKIALDPTGKEIPESAELNHNIFEMTTAELQAYDCGSKGNEGFPFQQKMKVYKPTLKEVFEKVEAAQKAHGLKPVDYNIEIKRREAWDGVYHPPVQIFVERVIETIKAAKLEDRTIIQSFDAESLRLARKLSDKIRLAWLIENRKTFEENMLHLGIKPDIYSPHFRLVDKDLLRQVHAQGLTIIPWTVNEASDIDKMIDLGVDGIISDYPGRVLEKLK